MWASRSVTEAEVITHRTAHEFVRDRLRQQILDGSLPPGTRLRQVEVAADLEVSTTPVRSALLELANEGLVELGTHRGAWVRRIDARALKEIYDARLIVEPAVMRHVTVGVRDERLAEAEALLDRMRSVDDPVQWARLNHAFHRTLVEGASSRPLVEFVASLQDTASAYVITALQEPAALETHNDQHEDILAALHDRNPDAVAIAVTAHLRHSLTQLLELAVRSSGEDAASNRVAAKDQRRAAPR